MSSFVYGVNKVINVVIAVSLISNNSESLRLMSEMKSRVGIPVPDRFSISINDYTINAIFLVCFDSKG